MISHPSFSSKQIGSRSVIEDALRGPFQGNLGEEGSVNLIFWPADQPAKIFRLTSSVGAGVGVGAGGGNGGGVVW